MNTRAPARTEPGADVALPSDTAMTPARRRALAIQDIGRTLETFAPVVKRLLADTGVGDDTFRAQIMNAVRSTKGLDGCAPETIIGAALRCAQLGLAPNDVRNLAWIIPYGQEATFQMGYGGVMELARRATPGLKFDGRPVYPNDEFDVDLGRAEPLKHKPHYSFGKDRGGEPFLWYVRARFPDGDVQIHALDREGVEYHRSFSKQPNGQMWTKSYDAAALKSVVTDMKRWLPMSTQLAVAFASDDQVIDVRTVEPIETTATTATYTPPPAGEIAPTTDTEAATLPIGDEG